MLAAEAAWRQCVPYTWALFSSALCSTPQRKSDPEFHCGKDGSINLELDKSLFFFSFFISENEIDLGYQGKGKQKREREDREGKTRGGRESIQQQSNSRDLEK